MNQIPRLMPRFYLGQLDLLVQLAEEASELSAAAAKMVRVIRGVNPTPVKYEEALAALLEEAADVQVVLGEVLNMDDWEHVAMLRTEKLSRWTRRLEKAHAVQQSEKLSRLIDSLEEEHAAGN